MKKNMGNTDRLLRMLAAAVLLGLYFSGTLTGVAGTVALVVAGIFALTSVVSFCPLYTFLGLNTCPSRPANKKING